MLISFPVDLIFYLSLNDYSLLFEQFFDETDDFPLRSSDFFLPLAFNSYFIFSTSF
jgi:hypothetical protein